MFEFCSPDRKHSIDMLNRQFCKFFESKGKLPFFSVSFFPYTAIDKSSWTPLCSLNGFCISRSEKGLFMHNERRPDGELLFLPGGLERAFVYYPAKEMAVGCTYIGGLLMQAYKYVLSYNGGMLIHSAAVIHEDKCILFCGMPGAGKSTQAELWHRYLRSWALNFDQPAIVAEDGGFFAHGTPWSGKEQRFVNSYAPLAAIVFVEQAPVNEATLLSPAEAFSRIYLNNYLFPVSPQQEEQYFDNIKAISAAIPVYTLKCTISEDAVRAVYCKVFSGNYESAKKECNMTYKRKDGFMLKDIAGDKVIVSRGAASLDFSAIIVMNDTGAFLWDFIENPTAIEDITSALAQEYSIDVETARKDAQAFIDKMIAEGLAEAV